MIEIVKRPSENNNVETESAAKVQVTPKPIDASNLVGQVFGDYVVISLSGRDSSGHKLWTCVCPFCGDTFSTTSYELIKGRKKTVCKNCAKEKLRKLESDCTSSSTLDFDDDCTERDDCCDCDDYDCDCNDCCEDECCEDREDFTLGNNTVVFLKNTPRGYSEEFYSHIADGVFVRELKQDLLEMPVYYYIAHCLPADLTVYGETAKRIDEAFDLVERILSDLGPEEEISVGDILGFGNVFTLIPNPKARTRPSLNDLREAVKTLAVACAKEQVMYLAMPRIGCGHNGLNWNEVKLMICEEFAKAYRPHCENNYFKPIKITFCYLD